MVEVVYLKDHASYKKGYERKMPLSTAKALETKGILKLKKQETK